MPCFLDPIRVTSRLKPNILPGEDMFSVELFLGFPLDSSFISALGKLDPREVGVFIRDGDQYLQEVTYREQRYLGKYVGEMSSIESLELIESNVFSLLKKLIPDYPYKEVSLSLFPVPASLSD